MGGLSARVVDRDSSSMAPSRGRQLQKKRRLHTERLAASIQRHAREQAEEETRRVPWQLLLEARNQDLDWQEFYYWARSIMESENGIPNWLSKKLDELCPGFLTDEKRYLVRHPNEATLTPVRIGRCIDEHVFGFAQQGGWLLAITFYAVRESRYQKASVCWSESVQKWRKARPIQYPSFEQWLREAAQCDETAPVLPRVRKERACFKLVDAERLAQAVSRFIEWEAFAYWVRLPPEVVRIAQGVTHRTYGSPQTEDQRVQYSHPQPHARLSSLFLRRIDQDRLIAPGASGSDSRQRFRLVGVGLSNFREPERKEDTSPQPALFE